MGDRPTGVRRLRVITPDHSRVQQVDAFTPHPELTYEGLLSAGRVPEVLVPHSQHGGGAMFVSNRRLRDVLFVFAGNVARIG